MRGIQISTFGGPEVLVVSELPEPVPGPHEQVFPVRAAGINYADTHQTEDSYLARQRLPLIPGGEVVVSGPDGTRLLGLVASGGYAERIAADPRTFFPIPDAVGDAQALALLVQGATAWHLLRTCAHLGAGETVVVHAGAGGVGTLAIQLARRWGAGRIIATASNESKRELARELGADVAIDPNEPELAHRLREANDGRGVDVVLEMTGGIVFDESLRALAPLGRLVTFGMASRSAPTPVVPAALMARSVAVIGFWLAHLTRRPAMLAEAVNDLMAMVAADELRTIIGGTYPLEGAADAHRALLDRSSVGKLVVQIA